MKNVTSQDPRKPAIVAALKAKTGCTKVTLLKESKAGLLFQGSCLRKNTMVPGARWLNMGTVTVTAKECGLPHVADSASEEAFLASPRFRLQPEEK